MSTGTLVMCHPQASYWQLRCLKNNTLINDVEKKNYSTHNPKLKKWCLWLVQGAVSMETFNSKVKKWAAVRNKTQPQIQLHTTVHKLHTVFCFYWNQKNYQRSFVGVCSALWDEQFQWSFFPVPFLCFSPKRQTLYRKNIKALTLWCPTCFHI